MSKTTWAAIVLGLAFAALTASLVMGKIDASGYGIALGAIGTLGATVIGFLSQDQLPKKTVHNMEQISEEIESRKADPGGAEE